MAASHKAHVVSILSRMVLDVVKSTCGGRGGGGGGGGGDGGGGGGCSCAYSYESYGTFITVHAKENTYF